MGVPELETSALLLRAVDYAEADKVCTFLTPTRGKIAAFARGVRGSKRRFRGGLNAFVELEVTLRSRNADAMPSVSASEAIRQHPNLGADLRKMAIGSLTLELVDRALHDEQGAELFDTLVRFLRWLDDEAGGPHRLEAGLFRLELLLLDALGLLPDFAHCARSGADLDDTVGARWLADVGLVTPDARHPGEPCGELPPGAIGYLAAIAGGRFPTEDAPALRAAVRSTFLYVWRHIGGRDLKAHAFYAQQLGG